MKLINFENYEVKIADEALLVPSIKKLFDMDDTPNKDVFFGQCAVIFFMKDPRSNYNYILDEKERLKVIIEQQGLPKTIKLTKELKDAFRAYESMLITTSSELLKDTRYAVEKVRSVLKNVELDGLDPDKQATALKSITSTISMIPKLIKDLAEAEKIIATEITEKTRAKGGGEQAVLEGGFDGWV